MVSGEPFVARFEVGELFGGPHETHVGHGLDEGAGILDDTGVHGVGPKLEGLLELSEDIDRLGDIDGAVGLKVGRITEFANTGMTGACVVPAMGGLGGKLFGGFVDRNPVGGIQLFEQHRELGRHDTTANDDDFGR